MTNEITSEKITENPTSVVKNTTKKNTEKKKKLSFFKKYFTIRKVCVNTTKALILGACLATSYTTITSNIDNINALQSNYVELKNDVKEINKSYKKIKEENEELTSKISEAKKSVEATEEKATQVETNLNSSKAQVDKLNEIVDKNATIR